nr:hypothetical protein GCM10020241_49070 [Streptoalloteichus tenebrarius]
MTSMWGAPMATRWTAWLKRDPRQARFLTRESLRWVWRNRAFTPWYLVRYWRLLRFRLANPHVVLRGMVFLGRNVEIHCRPGHGRLEIGRWVHIGDGNAIRCHEGSLRIGDKAVFGKDNTVNCYMDVEIGASTLVADWVYICDFDHITSDVNLPIKDQGIVKTPVRIGPDCWIGTKVTVLRGTRVGPGQRSGRARRGAGRHPGVLHRRRRSSAGGPRPQGRLRGERGGAGAGAGSGRGHGAQGGGGAGEEARTLSRPVLPSPHHRKEAAVWPVQDCSVGVALS